MPASATWLLTCELGSLPRRMSTTQQKNFVVLTGRERSWHRGTNTGPTCHPAAQTTRVLTLEKLHVQCKKTPRRMQTLRIGTWPRDGKAEKRRTACSATHFPASTNGNPSRERETRRPGGKSVNSTCAANCLHEPPASFYSQENCWRKLCFQLSP